MIGVRGPGLACLLPVMPPRRLKQAGGGEDRATVAFRFEVDTSNHVRVQSTCCIAGRRNHDLVVLVHKPGTGILIFGTIQKD